MARYSEERKEAVLSKLLPPYNMTVAELARQEGISEPTLYTWRNKAKSEGRPVPGRKATSEQWSAAGFSWAFSPVLLGCCGVSVYIAALCHFP